MGALRVVDEGPARQQLDESESDAPGEPDRQRGEVGDSQSPGVEPIRAAQEQHARHDDEREQLHGRDRSGLAREEREAPQDSDTHDPGHTDTGQVAPARERVNLLEATREGHHGEECPGDERVALDDPEVHHLADHGARVRVRDRGGERGPRAKSVPATERKDADGRREVHDDHVDEPRHDWLDEGEDHRQRIERPRVHAAE